MPITKPRRKGNGGPNHNDFPSLPHVKVKVAIDTMPACCTQAWYALWDAGELPSHPFECSQRHHIVLRADGWWAREGVKARRDTRQLTGYQGF